jgi:hypothetical protein
MQIKLYGVGEKTTDARIVIVHESNDDVQIVPYGTTTNSDTTIVITSGKNRFLDSRRGIDIGGDDRVVFNIVTGDSIVIAGPNKTCESHAYNTDVKTTLINKTQLQDTLNKYYAQSVYRWEVVEIIEKTVNFDLNRDGKIDVHTWDNQETKIIRDSCIKNAEEFNIIVVDNSSDGSNGMSLLLKQNPQRICYLHPSQSSNIYMTACHELGHGSFGLQHPFNEFSGFPKGGKDVLNIMNYGNQRNKFRKYQWEQINK